MIEPEGEYSSATVLFVWEHSTHDRARGNFPVLTGATMVVKIKGMFNVG